MKKVILLIAVALLSTSCFAGPNTLEGIPNEDGNVAGFFNGVWDGMISPISFVVSLFNENVEIYNPNSDGWYPFGFMLGIGGLGGGSASTSSRRR